jgi:hypothetical protein
MAVNINIPSQVTQSITEGVTSTAPSEDAVFNALADKANSDDLAEVATSGDYNDLINQPTIPSGTVTSVGLTMPSAFNVADSPVTGAGTLAVTGAGLTSQYVRGDGSLGNFPSNGGGGSSVNYYLNGSVSQGTFGGSAYYQMSKTPVFGAGTNFTRTNAQGNGFIASFITDAGDPNLLNIPGGNWNLEFYFNASSNGGNPSFYAELYKVDSSNAFTLIASGATNAEGITNGTTVDQYFTSIPIPQTTLLATDRIAIRIFVTPSGRNITLHTEDNNLSQIITTFSTGLNALNGLTEQVQYFEVGTSGTDFNINSATDTHTFNLPTASASNRGALSSADWTAFNGKQATLVSGTSIKTINGTSLLGSGDITISGGGGITVGTTAVTSGTIGRIFFQGTGDVVQQSASLFWDNTNARLGVGATPSTTVRLDVRTQGALSTDVAFRVRNSADSADILTVQGDAIVHAKTRINCGTSGMTTTGGALHVYAGNSADNVARFYGTTGNSFLNIRTVSNGALMELYSSSGVAGIILNGQFSNAITLAAGRNIVFDTVSGGRIGSATNEKIGFWNATPIVQPTTAVTAATLVSGGGTAITSTDTFDGYTLQKIVKALRNTGILA